METNLVRQKQGHAIFQITVNYGVLIGPAIHCGYHQGMKTTGSFIYTINFTTRNGVLQGDLYFTCKTELVP